MIVNLPAGPPAEALPLREAMRRFVSEDLWRAHEAATEARKRLLKRPRCLSTSIREWEAEVENFPSEPARAAQADLHRTRWAAFGT